MNKIFISDLHLEESRPDITQIFFNFLKACRTTADTLYILGDFFEAWVGDDNLTPFNVSIAESLREAANSGLKIYFTHGNRDFLVGKKFLRAAGCTLLPEEHVIDLFGTPTLLMHGDTLCTEDKAYLKFRRKARNWFFQQLFLLKPLKKRLAIADNYREASKQYTSLAPEYLMDVTHEEVLRVMARNQVLRLIHGHTHRPGVTRYSLQGQEALRTVLGAWHTAGNALICREDGSQDLVEILPGQEFELI